jgi:hypothetical protein
MLIPVLTRVDQGLLDRLEDWRRRQPAIPARAEALRVLIEQALDAERKPIKKSA